MPQHTPPLMDLRNLIGAFFFQNVEQEEMSTPVSTLLFNTPVYTGAPVALSRAGSSRGEDGEGEKEAYLTGSFCIFLALQVFHDFSVSHPQMITFLILQT